MKAIQGPNFFKFRQFFSAEFLKGFVIPANTFDNVNGQFPIGFMIWQLQKGKKITNCTLDVYDKEGDFLSEKTFYAYGEKVFITDWYRNYHTRNLDDTVVGAIGLYGSDFQHNNFIRITNAETHPNRWTYITKENLIQTAIYLAVRHCMDKTWLNNQDQFLFSNKKWEKSKKFQTDCLAFILFHQQNKITCTEGINHWIPFREQEVEPRKLYESHFMIDFLSGKIRPEKSSLFTKKEATKTPLQFSPEAQAVFEAGKALWKYYHQQPNAKADASLYDIRAHFQGQTANGRMKTHSEDENYTQLLATLREKLKRLARKIEVKVYEYEFLKR
jgi:hypothetical protein